MALTTRCIFSHQVAKYGEFSISCWDICCLSPMCKLYSEVINISAAYLYERQSDCWFMPTFYGIIKRLIWTTCIFIPIYDSVEDHWFLLVINITETEAEIWDSHRDGVKENHRRECAIAAIVQLHKVFADELRMFPELYMKLSSIKVIYPEVDQFVVNIFDPGIYVLKNMQHYRKRWYHGFHSAGQRVRLTLELINNPKMKSFMLFVPLYQLMSNYMKQPTIILLHHI
ncbi:hypothetical protein M0R45_035429 [Rubus argutus]|uniref:Ubiquitin-like protease family profile domain-containing protein n=1 Tax=Rubus argutus TaxID=59490 RepID=A0AAW1VXC5_RUBAR